MSKGIKSPKKPEFVKLETERLRLEAERANLREERMRYVLCASSILFNSFCPYISSYISCVRSSCPI